MHSYTWCKQFFAQLTNCAIITVLFTSCLKQNMDLPHDKTLVISFNQQTIPFTNADSAFVHFTKQGNSTPIIRKLLKMPGSFKLELEEINSGGWTAEIYLFTNKDNNGISNQYTTSLQFTADQISGIYFFGPSPTNTLWKKNIVLSTSTNDIVVIIPEDVTRPEFEIRTTRMQWDSFKVERGAFLRSGNINRQVATANWECMVNCMNSERIIRNNTAFVPFSNEMKTQSWNNGEITVTV